MVQTIQQTTEIPQLPVLFQVVDVPVMLACSLSGAALEKTFVLPQLQLVEKLPPVVHTTSNCGSSAVAVLQVVDISFTALKQIPTVLSDHRVSPVACGYGGRCPCLQSCRFIRCCLCEDRRDPTVLPVVIPVVAQDTDSHGPFFLRVCRRFFLAVACTRLVFSGVNVPRVVLSSLVGRPMMLGIMAGMNQKDSCPRSFPISMVL